MAQDKDIWTISDTLTWIIGYLERKGDTNPRLSAEWLLSDATGLSRVQLYTNFDQPLSLEERAQLREAVKRRGAGEPLQYLTGEVAFRHLVLKVKRGVLIPRPETELTVEWGLAALSKEHGSDAPLKVLDLCTGSGCIALSVAQENPRAFVTAVDIDATAVSLSKENTQALHLQDRVQILQGDLYEPLTRGEKFDLIIANPPYIPTQVLSTLSPEVIAHEPNLALDGGADGLEVFRRILNQASCYLQSTGTLVCELHETCLDDAASLAQEHFNSVSIKKDLAGRDRVLIAAY